MISDWFLEAANYCAGNFEAGVDEVDMCGLTTIPSVMVNGQHFFGLIHMFLDTVFTCCQQVP